MTLSGTESGVEALSDSELQLYESYATRAWATVLPPTAYGPPDFKGVWDPKQKGIRFYDDENFLAERQVTSNA